MSDGRQSSREWISRAARIVEGIGTESFPVRVLTALNACVPFEHTGIFVFEKGRRPRDFLARRLGGAFHQKYCGETYLLDPFYKTSQGRCDAGVFRMRDLDPSYQRYLENYEMGPSLANVCRERPDDVRGLRTAPTGQPLSEEIGFLLPLDKGRVIHVALIRSTALGRFSERDIDNLWVVTPILHAAFDRHYHFAPDLIGPDDGQSDGDAVSSWLANKITSRELEVIRCILLGFPTEAIAKQLNIAIETVKVHRKNAYRKLAVSSRYELRDLLREDRRSLCREIFRTDWRGKGLASLAGERPSTTHFYFTGQANPYHRYYFIIVSIPEDGREYYAARTSMA